MACSYATAARPYTVELRPHGNGHRYYATLPDGTSKMLKRVTTILETLNKPALIPWAVGQTLDACREKVQPGTAYTEEQLAETWEWAKGAQHRTKTEAAQYGTRAHQLIENYLHTGYQPVLHFEPEPVQNCYALFEEWWATQNLTVLDLEAYVADLNLGYGGTIDCLARTPAGDLVLLDWKTSKAVYPEMLLQVVAYGGAMAAMGLGMPGSASILRVGKEDAAFEVVDAWTTIEEARGLYHVWKNLVAVSNGIGQVKSDLDRRKRAAAKAAKAE